jgi:hypothetical protein
MGNPEVGRGDENRSRLVQGAFDHWYAGQGNNDRPYWDAFKSFRYGFMDGELMLHRDGEQNQDPASDPDRAYYAGWMAGRNQDQRIRR